MNSPFLRQLVDAAAQRYRAAGRFAFHFARGKLAGDPVFAGLLRHGLVPDGARVLDIGCGQGLLAAWLLTAREHHEAGQWPSDWPSAPRLAWLHGIELMPGDVEKARTALGDQASFSVGDMCRTEFGSQDLVVLLDVLHYVDFAAQDAVLQRVRECLAPGGRLLLRVGDANGGLGFRYSVWVDKLVCLARGQGWVRLYCRPLAQWQSRLQALGFAVQAVPMHQGTPFANMLLLATLA